ncbi:MAG TPA: serine/threonine protein kinase, partial [Pseudonocardiaceae bacterium]
MGGLAAVIGSLLSWLHRYPVALCPGAWPWTVTFAGAVLAVSPLFGAMLIALVRKGTGNQYDTPVMIVFGSIGVLFGFLLPWLTTTVVSNVLNLAARNSSAPGLTVTDIDGLNQPACVVAHGTQGAYLGLGQTGYEALTRSAGGTFGFAVYLVTLIGVPLLCLLTVMAQQRIALRRGPRWPGRLMWLPVLAYLVATVPLEANLMSHFWLGFLAASVAGLPLVAMLGAPSRSVINRPPKPAPAPAPVPASVPYRPAELYRQPPIPEPYRPQHI